MPTYYYNKRRKSSGPNKNEQRVQRRQEGENQDAPPLGQSYPTVRKLTIRLQFLSPQQQPISEETREFQAPDSIRFSAPCPGRCGVGSFDLAAKIQKVIEAREATSEGGGKCQHELYAGSAEVCGCELKCRVDVTYEPAPPVVDTPN